MTRVYVPKGLPTHSCRTDSSYDYRTLVHLSGTKVNVSLYSAGDGDDLRVGGELRMYRSTNPTHWGALSTWGRTRDRLVRGRSMRRLYSSTATLKEERGPLVSMLGLPAECITAAAWGSTTRTTLEQRGGSLQ